MVNPVFSMLAALCALSPTPTPVYTCVSVHGLEHMQDTVFSCWEGMPLQKVLNCIESYQVQDS